MTDDVTQHMLETFKEQLIRDVHEICQDIYKPVPKLMKVIANIIEDKSHQFHTVLSEIRDSYSGLNRELERMSALYFELKDKE